MKKILKKLENTSIYSTGRYGEWKYASMQEAFFDGKKISEQILSALHCKVNKKQLSSIYRSQNGNEVDIKVL